MYASQPKYGVRLTQDHICIRTPYKDVEVCRAVRGGRYSQDWRCWIWPRTQDAARALVDAFGPKLTQADGGADLISLAAMVEIKRDIPDPGHVPGLKTKPWKHQREAYGFASALKGAMLAMGMGTGKSLTSIGLLHRAKRALIICPKAVVPVWPGEFSKHAAYEPRIVQLSGPGEKKKDQLRVLRGAQDDVIVVVNYESAWRQPLSDALLAVPWDVVVLDEVHKIKMPGGRASKFCARLRKVAQRVYGLTGTPMPHSPMDLFAQYRAIDPSVFGTNFALFRQEYAIMGGHGGHEVRGYQNQERMREKFRRIAYQAGRDVIELPDATHTVIPVELGKKALTAYKSLARDLYAAVEGGQVTAANALVKLLRLQQLTGGNLKLDDGSITTIDTNKAEALGDLLESMGDEPAVVFCRFHSDIDAVHSECKKLGLHSRELSGRRNDLAAWQVGEGQVIAVQVQSGGVGVDLTRARYCVYYSLGFSLGDYEQSLARIHRPGQSRPVSYYHLVCEGTVDRQVYDALEARKNVVLSILEGIVRKQDNLMLQAMAIQDAIGLAS